MIMAVLNSKIERLRDYFSKRPDVLMAFIFGSYAKGQEISESDFDLGIYVREKEEEDRIWSEVTEVLEEKLDIVYLNEAPASLVSGILKTGVPLVIKDKDLYWDLYLKASSEAEDFLGFAKDFLRIYRETKSLIPEEKIRLLERFQFLDSELKDIKEFKALTFKDYLEDKTKRRNIERWTENIINATIDIAKIILASEKKRMPKTYEEALLNFGILAGLSEEKAKRFSRFANLRNLLAHEYLDILYKKVQKFTKEFPPLYKKISDFLEKYLQ